MCINLIQIGCLIGFPQSQPKVLGIQLSAVPQHAPSHRCIPQAPFGMLSYPPVLTLDMRRSMHVINDRMQRKVHGPALLYW